jgi:hypothetical protein
MERVERSIIREAMLVHDGRRQFMLSEVVVALIIIVSEEEAEGRNALSNVMPEIIPLKG